MKRVVIIGVGVVVLALLVGGMLWQGQKAVRAAAEKEEKNVVRVERGDVVVKVIETGTIDAVRSVDVRSRASGRLQKLLVDEGSPVAKGQLVALIDPLEISLQVERFQAQLRGAESAAARTQIELAQRRVSARASYDQAVARMEQLKQELKAQPTLTEAILRFVRARKWRHSDAQIKEFIEALSPLADQASVFSDLLNAAISEVDWHAVAEHS